MRLTILHYVAKALGVLIHVEGLPYGSRRRIARHPRAGLAEGNIPRIDPATMDRELAAQQCLVTGTAP